MKKNIENGKNGLCYMCGKLKSLNESFYMNFSPLFQVNHIHICKDCIFTYVRNEKDEVDIVKLRYILRLVDLPFLYDYWKAASKSKSESIGKYFSLLGLRQNKSKTYKDSRVEEGEEYFNLQNQYKLLEKQLSEFKNLLAEEQLEFKKKIDKFDRLLNDEKIQI
ncbi:MAG TPA: hypothetical protein DEP72_03775 [Clostridiales bacterium]|nr:MAG: hypothetical protein A2Y18_05295 [Clostridiales bacterium GWD2_32_19]HCC07273.1 hypothetical protein [Clostridiales bacterium]